MRYENNNEEKGAEGSGAERLGLLGDLPELGAVQGAGVTELALLQAGKPLAVLTGHTEIESMAGHISLIEVTLEIKKNVNNNLYIAIADY